MIPFLIAELFAILASFSFTLLLFGMMLGTGAGAVRMVPFFFFMTVYAAAPVAIGAFTCKQLAKKLDGIAYLASALVVGILVGASTAFSMQQWTPQTEISSEGIAKVFSSPLIALPTVVSLIAFVYLAKVRFKAQDESVSK